MRNRCKVAFTLGLHLLSRMQRWKLLLEEGEKLTFSSSPCARSLYIVAFSFLAILQSLD